MFTFTHHCVSSYNSQTYILDMYAANKMCRLVANIKSILCRYLADTFNVTFLRKNMEKAINVYIVCVCSSKFLMVDIDNNGKPFPRSLLYSVYLSAYNVVGKGLSYHSFCNQLCPLFCLSFICAGNCGISTGIMVACASIH